MKMTKMNISAWFVAKSSLTAYRERSGSNAKIVKRPTLYNLPIGFIKKCVQVTDLHFICNSNDDDDQFQSLWIFFLNLIFIEIDKICCIIVNSIFMLNIQNNILYVLFYFFHIDINKVTIGYQIQMSRNLSQTRISLTAQLAPSPCSSYLIFGVS